MVPQNALVYHQYTHLWECKSQFWTNHNIYTCYTYYTIEFAGYVVCFFLPLVPSKILKSAIVKPREKSPFASDRPHQPSLGLDIDAVKSNMLLNITSLNTVYIYLNIYIYVYIHVLTPLLEPTKTIFPLVFTWKIQCFWAVALVQGQNINTQDVVILWLQKRLRT